MQELDEKTMYETSDLNLAAVIFCHGYTLAKIDRSDPSRYKFIFGHTGDIYVVVSDYWERVLKCEPQQLFEAVKALKARMYGERPA